MSLVGYVMERGTQKQSSKAEKELGCCSNAVDRRDSFPLLGKSSLSG